MKRYFKVIILLAILLHANRSLHAQKRYEGDYRLVVTLHNAPFEALSLLDYNDQKNTFITGKKIAQFQWEFIIRDSLASNSEYMILVIPNKDTIANAYHQIRFFNSSDKINNSLANIGVQDKINYIEAEYRGQTLYEKENIARLANIKDSVILGNLICDDFNLILKKDSSDITVRSHEPNFGWFTTFNGDPSLTYNAYLQKYISLAKKFPNSRYLVTFLALNLYNFKTRQDVKSIYENFSPAQKHLKWSIKIEDYLSGVFVNSSLVNLDTKQTEPIVQEMSKYNLITFSASWCVPCIAEMPLLKNLYKNLNHRVDFTYVSMDREKDIQAFQNLLLKHHIPWRSLYAYNDLEKVKDLYFVVGIPHSLLVYPDGHMEVVDVRNKEIQKKLYLLK